MRHLKTKPSLTNQDKRILEIWFHNFYLWYISNNTQHNHSHFLMLPALLQTNYSYDAELIEEVWLNFLIDNPKPPSDDEILLAMSRDSAVFKCNTKMFNPFYKLKGKARRVRIQTYKQLPVKLMPKIKHETFHSNLIDFLLQMCYTFGNINNLFKR